MQARDFLNYRLKYCWPKVIYCICLPNELKREIKKKMGDPSKNLGQPWHTQAPLRTATASNVLTQWLTKWANT